jgi:pimeloyl-ACP methyl ester carboxylesterase
MRDHVVTSADGTRIAVRDHGGGGSDVLLVHGRSRTLVDWVPVLRHLDGVRAVCMDFRWHGRSDAGGSVAIETVLADFDAVIDALELERPVLVGHSMGGVVATYYASSRDTCRAILNIDGLDTRLLDPEDDPGEIVPPRKLPLHRNLADRGDDAWREAAIAELRRAEDEFGVPDDVVEAFIERALVRDDDGIWQRRPPYEFYELGLGGDTVDLLGALGSVTCPAVILLCTGRPKTPSIRDRPMQAAREAMLRKIGPLAAERPNVRIETIDGSHAVIWEKPAEIAAIVRSLL